MPTSTTPPVASFTSTVSPSDGYTFTFNGSGSTDPDGTVVSYSWDFGDGESDTGSSVTHTYDMDGAYLVTLTVTDDGGHTNSTVQLVPVEAPVPPLKEIPRRVAKVSAPADQRVVVTCGAGQWTYGDDFVHMNPVNSSIAVSPGERHTVSVYLRKANADDPDAEVSVGAAFFLPVTAAPSVRNFPGWVSFGAGFDGGFPGALLFDTFTRETQSNHAVEGLAFSDAFGGRKTVGGTEYGQEGFLGYTHLKLAGYNPENLTVDRMVLKQGDFNPFTPSDLLVGESLAVFGCTDWRYDGIYTGNTDPADEANPAKWLRPTVADFQPRPGDIVAAVDVYTEPSDYPGSPTRQNALMLVNRSYPDLPVPPTHLYSDMGFSTPGWELDGQPTDTKRLQMSGVAALEDVWNRYEIEVVVPHGARFLVPVVHVNPTGTTSSSIRDVYMTAAMVTPSQESDLTEIYNPGA